MGPIGGADPLRRVKNVIRKQLEADSAADPAPTGEKATCPSPLGVQRGKKKNAIPWDSDLLHTRFTGVRMGGEV